MFKDIENSIIRPCDIFLRGEIMTITNQANDERMSNAGSSTCFVMAYPNADLPARHDDILKWCRENFWRYMSDYGGGDNDVRIIPLRDVYFLSDGNEDYNDSLRLGNKTTVMLLAGMCFLPLMVAGGQGSLRQPSGLSSNNSVEPKRLKIRNIMMCPHRWNREEDMQAKY